jgi:hypothetical protein
MTLKALGLIVLITTATPALAACRSHAGREVVERLTKDGPAKTLQELSATQSGWNRFLKGVAGGDRCLIDAAVRLHEVSDGHIAEGIAASLGQALNLAPETVLRSIGDRPLLLATCGPPDVDEEIYDSRTKALGELHRRQRRVSVLRPSGARDRCLSYLRDAEEKILRFFKD